MQFRPKIAALPLAKIFSVRPRKDEAAAAPGARTDPDGNRLLPVLSAQTLLGDRNRVALVKQLRRLTSTTDNAWHLLYDELLHRFASYVQQLPASEAHHHAYPGGLLDHALDVSRNALLLRRSYLLPPGLPPEEASRHADRWTYATFAAALLHDVGKPATDQVIDLYVGGEASRRWSAWSGPMPIGAAYRVTFNSQRGYADHDTAAAFLARRIIPARALEWLSADPSAIMAMLGSLSRAVPTGPVGEIVAAGDGASAAEALGGDKGQFPSSRAQPLSSVGRIVIRELIETGDLPLNRPGAAGFTSDDDLWLVNKRFLNQFRNVLEERGVHVPPRNVELMDELTAHRVVVPTASGKATWRAQVEIPDEDFDQLLTFVRVRLSDLYPNGDGVPEPIAGSVTPERSEDGPASEVEEESTPPRQSTAARAKPKSKAKPKRKVKTIADRLAKALGEDLPDDDEPVGDVPDLPQPPHLTPIDSYEEIEGLEKIEEGDGTQDGADRQEVGQDRKAEEKAVEATDGVENSPAPNEERKEPEAFIEWVKDGVGSGDLTLNKPDTPLHVVEDGLFMVSPRIFRRYNDARYQHVERCFTRAGLHRRPEKGRGNIRIYEVVGDRNVSDLKGLLVPDGFGLKLPAPNPHLRPKAQPKAEAGGGKSKDGSASGS